MILLLAGHALVGLLIYAAARWIRRGAFALGAAPMVAALGYVAVRAGGVLDGRPVTERVSWVEALGLGFDLRMDGFGLLMVLVVSGIGVAVMAFGHHYFSPTVAAARIAGLLVVFAGSMLGIVLADNVLFLYAAWELTSITSWLLIGADHEDPAARAGAFHALMVTGTGGLAMLGGLVLLAQAAGTASLSGILEAAPSGGTAIAGLALVLVGVITKSAQYPAHAWLPGAMVAATPVSAYLHAATMVKAGIYLAARFAPVFASTGAWRPVVVAVGLVTMIAGGLRALRQHDLKLLLAMGTVSQLGFLLVLVGSGHPEATVAGSVLLLSHALFKATLFFVVGIVDHEVGTRDRRDLQGFGPGWGLVKVVTLVSAASMAGLPPLFGFLAKESAYEAFVHGGPWEIAVLSGLVAGSVLTVAYSARFAAPILSSASRSSSPPAPATMFVAPAAVLTGLTVAAGLAATGFVEPIVRRAAMDLDAGVDHVALSLWKGFEPPLLLSVLTIAAGALVIAGRERVARWQQALAPAVDGEAGFAAAVRGLNTTARRVTGVVQNGSLPIYATVILLTAVTVPGTTLVLGRIGWPGWPRWAETSSQVVLALLIVIAAVAASTLQRRFTAVLLLGAVGYAVGLVFVVQGAPDLALTQFAIETLFVVVFMLVLRHLPSRFERSRPAMGPIPRLATASIVAVTVFFFAVISAGNRVPSRLSSGLIERSLSEAEGRNVVNVVLVDFRGLDTLGEISVLVVAALGVVALARLGRPRDREVDR